MEETFIVMYKLDVVLDDREGKYQWRNEGEGPASDVVQDVLSFNILPKTITQKFASSALVLLKVIIAASLRKIPILYCKLLDYLKVMFQIIGQLSWDMSRLQHSLQKHMGSS